MECTNAGAGAALPRPCWVVPPRGLAWLFPACVRFMTMPGSWVLRCPSQGTWFCPKQQEEEISHKKAHKAQKETEFWLILLCFLCLFVADLFACLRAGA